MQRSRNQHIYNPGDFIGKIVGRPILVKLNNNTEYRGVLSSFDDYMNIMMEQVNNIINK